METKDIIVSGNERVFPCPLIWTVEEAENRIRTEYVIQGGGIRKNGVPALGTARISDLAGPLTLVGGEHIQQLVSKKRGVSVPISADNSKLFEVDDTRIRVECMVSNNDMAFDMDVLCDGGAAKIELTLPPRKIIQLGLTPFGKPFISKGSTNDTAVTIKFEPPVKVTMKFLRDNEDFEVREQFLVASCHLMEYEAEKNKSSVCAHGDSSEPRNLSGVKRKASDMSDNSISRDSNNKEKISIKLSPVAHRPLSNNVVLGQVGLSKFAVLANFEDQVLEIEEEDEIEYEE